MKKNEILLKHSFLFAIASALWFVSMLIVLNFSDYIWGTKPEIGDKTVFFLNIILVISLIGVLYIFTTIYTTHRLVHNQYESEKQKMELLLKKAQDELTSVQKQKQELEEMEKMLSAIGAERSIK